MVFAPFYCLAVDRRESDLPPCGREFGGPSIHLGTGGSDGGRQLDGSIGDVDFYSYCIHYL